MWIFESKKRDFLYIFLPGLLTLGLFEIIQTNYLITAVLSFIIFNFIDVGHVYSTVFRTIFDKKERERSSMYLMTPIYLIIIIFLWMYFKIPYFWSFVGYFTLYHNLRQGFGIMKWYEKKNGIYSKMNERFFYILTYTPLIMFHFLDKQFKVLYYTDQDILMYNNHHPFTIDFGLFSYTFPNIIALCLMLIYFLTLFTWIFNEIKNKSYVKEYNRILFMTYFFFVYYYSFVLSDNILEMTAALVVSHGIPYYFMMHYSLLKTRPEKFSWKKSMILLFIIGFIGGMINFGGEELITSGFDYVRKNVAILEYIMVFFYVIPVLCHFIWDAYIWRAHHPDAKVIYNKEKIYE